MTDNADKEDKHVAMPCFKAKTRTHPSPRATYWLVLISWRVAPEATFLNGFIKDDIGINYLGFLLLKCQDSLDLKFP